MLNGAFDEMFDSFNLLSILLTNFFHCLKSLNVVEDF